MSRGPSLPSPVLILTLPRPPTRLEEAFGRHPGVDIQSSSLSIQDAHPEPHSVP